MFVKKQDLHNNYVFEEIKKREAKERNKWMWIVLFGCFLFQMLPYCVALNLTTVFVGSDWQYWTAGNQTIIGLTFTMGAIGAAFAGPFIANIFNKKINMRLVYSIGIVLAIIGFVGSSLNSIIVKTNGGHRPEENVVAAILWISNIISQIGVMIFSGLGVNNLISKWWPAEKRGFALGLAFAGGSLGNIWMQSVVAELAKIFGNGFNKITGEYNVNNYQFATYMIMGAIGLVGGLIAVMFTCRKPLPPIDILNPNTKAAPEDSSNNREVLEASPLVTQKYPPYWILAVGYLILQMGTVHASTNTSFIIRATLIDSPGEYTDVVQLGGILFGVFCLIGNTGGGIINDKLGPSKSIFLAGMTQVAAIFCLMFSVKNKSLVYLYYVLSGLSVYVYTSTPAFISGRLYGAGQSNAHMSILGIFIALGFAIVNSISGSITGKTDASNITNLLGQSVQGNWLAWSIFAIVCMAVGTIIVSVCCAIITGKGIKGLLEYSPTKYTRVIMFRHSLAIKFASFRIQLSGYDFRKSEERINSLNKKKEADKYLNSFEEYSKYVSNELSGSKYSKKEIELITILFFYKNITISKFNQFIGENTFKKEVKDLLSKKVIEEVQYGNLGSSYKLSSKEIEKLNANISKLEEFDKIINENKAIDTKVEKLDVKLQSKLEKINQKLEVAKNSEINEEKKNKLVEKANLKISKINSSKDKKLETVSNKDDWTKYKVDYAISEKLVLAEQLKTKLETAKQDKIMGLQKKIFVSQYVNSYNKLQQIDGHDLLINYYKDKWTAYDNLITKKVKDNLERKQDKLEFKINNLDYKINKNNQKRDKIFG